MALFKLLAGKYQDNSPEPVNYVPGDVVESELDLDEMFKNKFIRLAEGETDVEFVDPKTLDDITLDNPEVVPEEDEDD